MLLSLKWLREFVPFEGKIEDLAHRLTMLGLEVEEIFNPFTAIEPIVVGHVLECEPHPESDHLSMCKVDVGQAEALPIICGAPNVAKGQKVAVALVGTTMPGGMKIKKAKLRGQVSMGMICSETELELGSDGSGIMVLDHELEPGTSLVQALDLETCVFDVGITPNRADCLSVLGIAREVATAYNLPLTLPQFNLQESEVNCQDLLDIEIENAEQCPLYQARILQNVKIGSSPAHIRYRLLAVGLRPINAVVDVTNYILMELGQPLHAFDRNLLQGSKIKVKEAKQDEKFTTLDGQERNLIDSDLVIADENRTVALAGVMGGANSEINDNSVEVVLESAIFNPPSIRKTARRLSLPSEASFRFERGVDQVGNTFAMDRAAALMVELAGGQIAAGVAKSEPRPFQCISIAFDPQRCKDLLALDLSDEFCQQTLTALGCQIESQGDVWQVIPPSYRLDLEREVDLTEEVGRVWGLDRIPAHLPKVSRSLEDMGGRDFEFTLNCKVKDWGKGLGLRECVNYSFVGSSDLDSLGISLDGRVMICNPLTEEQNVMRPELVPGLLNNLKLNLGQGNTRLKLFEVAHTFKQNLQADTQTDENNRLAILLYGSRLQASYPFQAEEDMDYAEIKGLVEHFALSFGLEKLSFELQQDHSYLEPAVICKNGEKKLGELGMLRPELADNYNAKAEVWLAELDLDSIQSQALDTSVSFVSIPRFPVVRRDMTIIAPQELQFASIVRVLEDMKIPILENISLIDVYRPKNSEDKHITLRLTYRHADKTLKDKEVDKTNTRAGEQMLKKLGVRFP